MKSLFFLTIFLAFSAWAKPHPLFVCLGKEEKLYHDKKVSGPFYHLNQAVISEFLQMEPTVILAPGELKQVCQNTRHPSLKILEALLLKKEKFFIISEKEDEVKMMMAQKSIENLVNKSPDLFWEFIAQIQALSPTHDCLNRKIPMIEHLKTQSLYLEEELGEERIFSHHKKIKDVFSNIEKVQSLFKICQQEQKRKPKK